MKGTGLALSACFIASVLSACGAKTPLTQIVVAVDSDWDGFSRAEIDIGGFQHPVPTVTADLKNGAPRHVALVHDGGPLGPMSITVRAYVSGSATPVLTESRTDVYFKQGKTLLLRIDLLLKCIGQCDAGMACLGEKLCVDSSSSDATALSDWDGDIGAIRIKYHVKNGDVWPSDGGNDGSTPRDAGEESGAGATGSGGNNAGSGGNSAGSGAGGSSAGNGGGGNSSDAGMHKDSGMPGDSGTPPGTFAYAPSNLDATSSTITGLERMPVMLDCANPAFDSTDLTFSNWCGPKPSALTLQLDASHDAALLVMSSLDVASGSTLQLKGDKPVILLVFGTAKIDGTIDASAHGTTAGPGGDRDCSIGLGATGKDGSVQPIAGASGGGGGGFGSAGGPGGGGNASASETAAGQSAGSETLVPLRGGCGGGTSGNPPTLQSSGSGGGPGGAGGGAVQISVAGQLDITGRVLAVGGGGGIGQDAAAGGGGGGSGGAILLEAASFAIDANAVLSANGGGGGAGQPYPLSMTGTQSSAGQDGTTSATGALAGVATGNGGPGGIGGSRDTSAGPGGRSSSTGTMASFWGGGGGGGGGVGRIRLNGTATCTPPGVMTPAASVTCKS